MRKKILIVLFLLLLLSTGQALAGSFDVDPRYSTVMFKLKNPSGHLVGFFGRFEGTVGLNEDNSRVVNLKAIVDTASVSTAQSQRDRDLLGDDFLAVKKYQTAIFTAKKILDGQLTGDLTFRGKTKEITLTYVLGEATPDLSGQKVAAVLLQGKVSRKDFGINFNPKLEGGGLLFGDEVGLVVELRGVLK